MARFASLDLSPEVKQVVLHYQQHLKASGSGNLRVGKITDQLRVLLLHLGKDITSATMLELQGLVAGINDSFGSDKQWSDATKADYRRAVKQFFNWYQEEDPRLLTGDLEAKKVYKFIKKIKTASRPKKYEYSEIINEEELDAVLRKGCLTTQQKAFLSVLHEGGFRAGEMLNILVKDVDFKETGMIWVRVDGKTGERCVPLVKSMPYLAEWYNTHPKLEDPNSFLWLGNNPSYRHEPLKHVGAKRLVDRCFHRAKITKKHNLHWFRHSRATLNATWMTEVQLCNFMGWRVGSHQVRNYVHSGKDQLKQKVAERYGLQTSNEQKITLQTCSCGMTNTQQARYCARCGRPLSVRVGLSDEAKKAEAVNEAFELLAKIMSDPALRQQFEEYKNQGGIQK